MGTDTGDRSRAFPAIERKHGHPAQYWFDRLTESDATTYAEQMALLQEGHGFSRAHANALVMTHRGSPTTRKFATPADYFATLDATKATTARAIFSAIQKGVPGLELVIAWNQPVLKAKSGYVFGMSAATHHLTLNPFSASAIAQFEDDLAGLQAGKKTFRVPADWTVNAKLLQSIVRFRLAELA